MLKRSNLGAGLAVTLAALSALAGACSSSGVLPAPKSDSQSDDPDDPGAPGTVGAVGATTGKDGGGDASNKCNIDRDCKVGLRCFFPVMEGCEAQGQCLDYQDTPDCTITKRCTCAGTRISTCAPLGYATLPVQMPCADVDASSD
ncbi:MAG: hypothetical protein ABIP39_12720 [Polyangiaceae bacterium]